MSAPSFQASFCVWRHISFPHGMEGWMYMTPVVLLLTAVALSMDALAVSISNGMTIKHLRLRDALKTGFFFGAFQALMPAIGWLAGTSVREMIVSLDHWVAFGLLALIGGKMIWDTVHGEDDEHVSNPTDTRVLLVMAVATSIDALAVGISLAMEQVSVAAATATIGLVTFALCTAGMMLGKKLGEACQKRAGFIGGVILIAIGLKILIEHLSQGV